MIGGRERGAAATDDEGGDGAGRGEVSVQSPRVSLNESSPSGVTMKPATAPGCCRDDAARSTATSPAAAREREPEGWIVGGEELVGRRRDRFRCREIDGADRPLVVQRHVGAGLGRRGRLDVRAMRHVPRQADEVGDERQRGEEPLGGEPRVHARRQVVRQVDLAKRLARPRQQIAQRVESEPIATRE